MAITCGGSLMTQSIAGQWLSYMPDIAADSIPVAFGDLSYFWILERQPLSVKILTELYSRENLTGYAAYERINGRLIRPEAVQLLSIK